MFFEKNQQYICSFLSLNDPNIDFFLTVGCCLLDPFTHVVGKILQESCSIKIIIVIMNARFSAQHLVHYDTIILLMTKIMITFRCHHIMREK